MEEGAAPSCTFPASAASASVLARKEGKKKRSTESDRKFKNQRPVLDSQKQARQKLSSLHAVHQSSFQCLVFILMGFCVFVIVNNP